MPNPYTKKARRAKAHERRQIKDGDSHRTAARVAAVRAIAALDTKNPAEIVAAIADGKIPYVTINLGGPPE